MLDTFSNFDSPYHYQLTPVNSPSSLSFSFSPFNSLFLHFSQYLLSEGCFITHTHEILMIVNHSPYNSSERYSHSILIGIHYPHVHALHNFHPHRYSTPYVPYARSRSFHHSLQFSLSLSFLNPPPLKKSVTQRHAVCEICQRTCKLHGILSYTIVAQSVSSFRFVRQLSGILWPYQSCCVGCLFRTCGTRHGHNLRASCAFRECCCVRCIACCARA